MPEEKEKDLVLGEGENTEQEIWEEYDLHSEIASATNALMATEGMDLGLLNKTQQEKVKSIRRKAVAILHKNISDIYSDVFGRDEKGEDGEDDD